MKSGFKKMFVLVWVNKQGCSIRLMVVVGFLVSQPAPEYFIDCIDSLMRKAAMQPTLGPGKPFVIYLFILQ